MESIVHYSYNGQSILQESTFNRSNTEPDGRLLLDVEIVRTVAVSTGFKMNVVHKPIAIQISHVRKGTG